MNAIAEAAPHRRGPADSLTGERVDPSSTGRSVDLVVFLAMEQDLRMIRGALAAFRVFAQSADPIDPAAIAVLTTCAGEAERRLTDLWREQVDRPP